MPAKNKAWYFFNYFAFAASLICLAYTGKQSEFLGLITNWILCCFFYFNLIRQKEAMSSPYLWWLIPLFIKLALIFVPPELSNDYVRFWWDGFLSHQGVNPYLFTPQEIIQSYSADGFIDPLNEHYPKLNSKEYHTVYPPLSQLLFYISASASGGNLHAFSAVLKLLFVLADCLTLICILKILKNLEIPKHWAFLYFANPLCIIELQGNLHTEQFMILFLASAIYFSIQNKPVHIFWSLTNSVLSKLNALLLFPLFVRKSSEIWTYIALLTSSIATLYFLYLPISVGSEGFGQSIGLYFQQFEFNSLFYSYLRDLLFNSKLYELKTNLGWILLVVFFITSSVIFIIQFLQKKQNAFPFGAAWWVLFIFYCLSSTVHPWYICPIIFLGLFYLPFSSMIWSFLIFFSYSHYDPDGEAYYRLFTGLAYFIVFVTIYLEKKGKLKSPFILQ